MALTTITDQHAEKFLQATHDAYLGIPERKPFECNRHIYSALMSKETTLSNLELLEMSRSWPLVAAIDNDGTGITAPFHDTGLEHFVFTMNNDDIDQQLREMTLPQGSVAFSISFERLVEMKDLTNGQATPSKVRQTIVVLQGGRLLSLLTQPDLGTCRPTALNGGTIDLFKDVMIRTAA
jgi:hypothetical protein